jgi:hypothetical protein
MSTLKVLCVAAALLVLAGCNKQAESAVAVGHGFNVEKLFTAEGCTVFRFYDGAYRYFTNCSGSTTWQEGGKLKREVSVMGGQQ